MTEPNEDHPWGEPSPQTSGVAAPPRPPGETGVDGPEGRGPRRALLFVALVAVIALVGAGVLFLAGDDDADGPSATALLARSLSAVEDAGNAKMALTLDANLEFMGQKIALDVNADGIVSFAGG
ncbi:MAG TPA: hypothetical protein VMY34_01880, partial [Acidimicrobiales bacterium]|nr:hypothetical protein [Acidimicrobiales bacterium]